jgi:catechol 2,3-dioxygenase-like lactoylglutathione lyase family enzyme
MKIRKVIETAIYCDSVPEMVEFYQNVLDLELLEFPKVSERNAFFKCGSSILIIFNRALSAVKGPMVPEHGSVGPGHIAIEIENGTTQFWKNILIEKQVTIEKEITWEHSGATSIYFRDPGNNSIELTEQKHWNL